VDTNEYYCMAKRARHQCERQYGKYKTPLFHSHLLHQISYCSSLVSKLKSIFYSNIIASCVSNPKKLWSKFNLLLAKSSETVLPDASDHRSLANKFCDFFIQKIPTIHQNLVCSDNVNFKPDFSPPIFD
jgi:hypothetical protein